MTRSRLVHSLLTPIVTLTGCFNPRQPIVVSVSDSAATDSGADTTMDTGSDPTIGSSTEPTGSTDPTASTTLSTTDSADASTSDTDPTGSTDDGGPLCGNMMLDGDEACDDGNDVNGDGCNNDCVESGTLLWELVLPSNEGVGEAAVDVAVSDDDVVAFLWNGGGAPHIDTFDSDGAALGSIDGPVGDSWVALDFFGNGDFAVSVTGGSAIEVARISAAGAELWSSGAPGSGAFQPGTGTTVVATTDDDDVAFAGTANAAIWGGKFDGGGAFDWSDVEQVAAPGWARGTGIACEADGTCVVAGFTDANGNSNGEKEIFLRLLAPGGAAIWTATYAPTSGYFEGGHVAIAPTGAVAVAGSDNETFLVLGYTSDGDPAWSYLYDDIYPYGLASDVDGNFVIAGNGQRDDFSEGVNALIRKLDADGNEVWTRSYNSGGAQGDESRSVATDSTGRIFVVGSTEQADGDGSSDAWIRAYAP
jgi:cysteine-rich repeat protein